MITPTQRGIVQMEVVKTSLVQLLSYYDAYNVENEVGEM